MAQRRLSSGTLIVIAVLVFATLVAVGRLALMKLGESFEPPATAPVQQ